MATIALFDAGGAARELHKAHPDCLKPVLDRIPAGYTACDLTGTAYEHVAIDLLPSLTHFKDLPHG